MRQAWLVPSLPGPLRAAVGLVAVVADNARQLPDRAIELPMLAMSTALQLSLRAQQQYAALTARGDEVLTRGPEGDEVPEWATFDAPLDPVELKSVPAPRDVEPSRFDVVGDD